MKLDWNKVSAALDHGEIMCTSLEQCEQLLECLAEHGIKWNSGTEISEYGEWRNDWYRRNHAMFMSFELRKNGGLTYGDTVRDINKVTSFSSCLESSVSSLSEDWKVVDSALHTAFDAFSNMICTPRNCMVCPLYNNGQVCPLGDLMGSFNKVYSFVNDFCRKRKDVKEMTVSEIEKLLGYPVKIVKEKE